ncbi:MAG: F0F1 ATP synthase subunit gamma, partial [Gemmataceae bacterium]|nr:F0F1 ATP synthase subunit gamma [Gemmataceae bacterium]
MAKTRELVRRRKAIGNIKKITRTMELIATARFKKAMDRAAEAEAYTRKIAELAADLSANAGDVRHPLLEVRPEIKAVRVLVLGSNRGLAGGYNASILRVANTRLRELQAENALVRLDLSGKRIIANFRYQR